MVHPVLLGRALLRAQRASLPPIFCRYKSFTQALETGRHRQSDRFPSRSRSRPRGGRYGRDEKDTRYIQDEVTVPRAQKIDRARELYLSSRGPAPGGSRRRRREERQLDAPPQRQRPFASSEARLPKGDRFEHGPLSSSRSASSKDFREQPQDHERNAPTRRRERRFEPSDTKAERGGRFAGSERPSSGRGASRAFREEGQEDERNEPPPSSLQRFKSVPSMKEGRSEKFERPRNPMSNRSISRGSRREHEVEDQDEKKPSKSSRSQPEVEPYVHVHFDRKGENLRTRVPPYTEPRPERDSRRRPESPFPRAGELPNFRNRAPESLPYSTAASEFIYGYSSVLAAVKANRRKFYNLYIHTRGANRGGLLQDRALLKNVASITKEVGDEYMRALDKASSGRPHNGVVLEASPLACPPITELNSESVASATFNVAVDQQSAEDALINGKQEQYPYKSAGWRHPLILYIDGVLDEGNLGAIARSAYYLGADAIITPTRQSAPWSHVALKASAGAAEAIPIFKVREPADFLGKSSRNGWRIYASDAIPPSMALECNDDRASSVQYTFAKSVKRLPADHCPVGSHPTILMMGAEGTGLKNSLLNLAHYKVGIRHGRDVDEIGVDSLNVSVAASLLCYEMLKKPSVTIKSEDALF